MGVKQDINSSKTLDIFPFLESFPFNEYDIYYDLDDQQEPNLDPIIIKASKNKIPPIFINFDYNDNYTKITISFYSLDIETIIESTKKITKFDSVRKDIDDGIKSDDLIDKIKSIKSGEKFIKQISEKLIAGSMFDMLLDKFLEQDKIKVPNQILRKIKSKYKTVGNIEMDNNLKRFASIFYNIHLNYIKIILGLIIAKKLH